jgi:uncharacterized linocin/CFP29 family protein
MTGTDETADNNLYRSLAPISAGAWAQIQEEASRTVKRNLAARRVVDVTGPLGFGFAAVTTGHVTDIAAPSAGLVARSRGVLPLVEIRVPFTLDRSAIDDVARGSQDSDWQPVKDAATTIAHTEDRAVFDGYAAAAIAGIRETTSNPPIILPADARSYPDAVAQALSQLRLAGVEGPYALVLDADAYTAVAETRDHGYPILEQLNRLVPDGIIWAPALRGGYLLTTRGGDYELTIGQDISIGYLQHTAATVDLYLQETFTFAPYTSEASVYLSR